MLNTSVKTPHNQTQKSQLRAPTKSPIRKPNLQTTNLQLKHLPPAGRQPISSKPNQVRATSRVKHRMTTGTSNRSSVASKMICKRTRRQRASSSRPIWPNDGYSKRGNTKHFSVRRARTGRSRRGTGPCLNRTCWSAGMGLRRMVSKVMKER